MKSKVVLVVKHYAMGSAGIALPFLTSAPDGGERSVSCPGHCTPGERACDAHWIGGWVGPRISLDIMEKRKILHCWESNPGHPAHLYTDWAILIPYILFVIIQKWILK